jgi:hypothetical protein
VPHPIRCSAPLSPNLSLTSLPSETSSIISRTSPAYPILCNWGNCSLLPTASPELSQLSRPGAYQVQVANSFHASSLARFAPQYPEPSTLHLLPRQLVSYLDISQHKDGTQHARLRHATRDRRKPCPGLVAIYALNHSRLVPSKVKLHPDNSLQLASIRHLDVKPIWWQVLVRASRTREAARFQVLEPTYLAER